MFENIGGKIKTLAEIICWIGIAGSIVAGFLILMSTEGSTLSGIFLLLGGPLFSWIGSFVLYGFGELIEKTSEIARNTYDCERKMETLKKHTCKADIVPESENNAPSISTISVCEPGLSSKQVPNTQVSSDMLDWYLKDK